MRNIIDPSPNGEQAIDMRSIIVSSTDLSSLELLTEAEAARSLRVSQRHLQRLVARGVGPPRVRLGERRVAYPKAGLLAWIAERTTCEKHQQSID